MSGAFYDRFPGFGRRNCQVLPDMQSPHGVEPSRNRLVVCQHFRRTSGLLLPKMRLVANQVERNCCIQGHRSATGHRGRLNALTPGDDRLTGG